MQSLRNNFVPQYTSKAMTLHTTNTAHIERGPAGLVLRGVSLSHFLALNKIEGSQYDSVTQSWTLPSKRSVLARVLAVVPEVSDRDYWLALLDTNTSVQDKPREVEPVTQLERNDCAPQHISQPEPVEARTETVAVEPEPVAVEVLPPIGKVKSQPWQHQLQAYHFALGRFAAGRRGVMLALEMGCGKSKVTIDILQNLKYCNTVLIVCPKRVIQVWPGQFAAHAAGDFLIVTLTDRTGTVAQKVAKAKEQIALAAIVQKIAVIVVNYETAWREEFANWATSSHWDMVVLDEIHRIKSPGGKASMFFKRLGRVAQHRLGLTGTPMPHSPLDVYAQFRFLDISIFGTSFNSFKTKYAVFGGYQDRQVINYQNLDMLEERMRLITFRVTKDVLNLIPPTFAYYETEMSPTGHRVYHELEKEFIAGVNDGIITADNALVKLLRLQQITGGWVKLDDGRMERVCDAKQKLLSDTLLDLGDEPIVVFCRFHTDMDSVHEACAALGLTSLELSGRRDELAKWQAGGAQVIAVQIKSGSEGNDFTRSRYAIFYSLTFSLGEYTQAQSRVHRPGQTRAVTYIHLACSRSVDVKIVRALEKRHDIVTAILNEIGGVAEAA